MRRAVTSSHSRFRKTPALRAPANSQDLQVSQQLHRRAILAGPVPYQPREVAFHQCRA